MVEIKLCGTSEKRPWLAQLTGVEVTKDGKTRFARNFQSGTSGCRRIGATDEYAGSIYSDGIYEACEARCRYFLIVFGTRKVLRWSKDIFPKNWSEYMREHNCSYGDVWEQAWGMLCNTYECMRLKSTLLA
jgi:hypothetical protein